MLKKLLLISIVFLSCNKDVDTLKPKQNTYKIELNARLPLDQNGFYHLTIDTTKNQTLHRISGFLKVNDSIPTPPEKIEWESNLYWYIIKGDVVANIQKTYINYFTGNLTVVSLPPLVASKDELVPTINPASYSGYENGEINTMIAPISKMKGDTLIVKASIEKEFKIIKIVLE